MGENIYDLMFIIGTNSILHEVKCTKKAFIKDISICYTNFSKQLTLIIERLYDELGSKILSKLLQIPGCFIEEMNQNSYKAGYCNICDNHVMNLKSHLREIHRLNTICIDQYFKLFPDVQFYMPKEYKGAQRIEKIKSELDITASQESLVNMLSCFGVNFILEQ